MTTTTHDNCTKCEWLARTAERTAKRTAKRQGQDQWLSTTDVYGTTHVAHYQEES